MARGPAELEFKKNAKLSWSQQMESIIAMLLQAGHREWIEWTIQVSRYLLFHKRELTGKILELVHATRTEIVIFTDGPQALGGDDSEDEDAVVRNFALPSKEAIGKFVRHGALFG